MRAVFSMWMVAAVLATSGAAWSQEPESTTPIAVMHMQSRAVLLDVLVTDRDGKPVRGLKQDAFALKENGKPQTVNYFEEHDGASALEQAGTLEFPKLPRNVFSNFSPIKNPPALNVLLLDGMNSSLTDQINVRTSAVNYLKAVKPGERVAIFVLGGGMRLTYVQGFADDPAVLAMALGFGKHKTGEPSSTMPNSSEANAQANVIGMMNEPTGGGPGGSATNTGAGTGNSATTSPTSTAANPAMIAALQNFLNTTQNAQANYNTYMTLDALEDMATYLGGFPGRKNLIWLASTFPVGLYGMKGDQWNGIDTTTQERFDDRIKRVVGKLAAARVALYPVRAGGVATQGMYSAENTLNSSIHSPSGMLGNSGAFSQGMMSEGQARNASFENMTALAEQTGGKIFTTNDLAKVIDEAIHSTDQFYTVSYSPTNQKMDGGVRSIDVQVNGGKYKLIYRKNYIAEENYLPGTSQTDQVIAFQKEAAREGRAHDPLLPFMQMGMPQLQQILYKAKVDLDPTAVETGKEAKKHYKVTIAVNLADLKLHEEPNGNHTGILNIALVLFDKYGQVESHKDHVVSLDMKPDAYAAFQQNGVQLHAGIDAPKSGEYHLRLGVFDQNSRKVGTLELPLNAVQVDAVAAK